MRIESSQLSAPGPDTSDLGEGRHVLQADVVVHVAAFGADELEIVRAAEAPFLARPLAGPDGRMVLVEKDVGLGEIRLAQAVAGGANQFGRSQP